MHQLAAHIVNNLLLEIVEMGRQKVSQLSTKMAIPLVAISL
jgi:hypothetical protein